MCLWCRVLRGTLYGAGYLGFFLLGALAVNPARLLRPGGGLGQFSYVGLGLDSAPVRVRRAAGDLRAAR